MFPLQARVNLGAMALKKYSTFPKAPGLEPHHQVVLCNIHDACYSYPLAIFWYVVVYSMYITWPKQFKLPTLVGIMIVGALACSNLLHSMCELKIAQINLQCCLIQELMLNKFDQGNNIMEATKKHLLCKKWRCSNSTITGWLKKFC